MSALPTGVDGSAAGLTGSPVDALRYGGGDLDPSESTGIILENVPEGARVLDVGCGVGRLAEMMRDLRRARVVGIEPQAERAAAASARGISVVPSLFCPEAVADLGVFDAVVFADVLEHLAEPGAALRLAASRLVPGGRVIAAVPNVAHWTVRLDLARGRFDYAPFGIMDATHLRWFTRASFSRLFESCGFRIVTRAGSAGAWMPDYSWRRPWKWISRPRRDDLVRRLARRFPSLCACQHIVVAVVDADSARVNA